MTTPTYDREQANLLRAADALNAAGVRTVNTTDPVRALPGDLQWKLDTLRPGSCGFASLTAEEWDYVRAALAQQPEAPAQEAFGYLYRIVSPQIPATRDGPWIGPGVNFKFGPPPADTPCVQYLALYTAPQPAIPEGKWRLLKKGEAIQRGDEILEDNCVEWGPLCGWERGMAYDPAAFVPVRRRIKESDHG
ncbi:hypothetical protein CSC62_05270 [Pseudoxanthomonas jiangsuensis]|uniref:hypothetical protein n=1 Tax=Pseudoxanthomonas jiangsuensis TaxID=619688 RepID=UPI00139127EE|nr:hypothetical protein [Pseudoxanthomonas jiangsuensis]KAF1698320.1 hypothetical protein CSC62_05270 [Pseudoxanthomonas jiangsuensis]